MLSLSLAPIVLTKATGVPKYRIEGLISTE